MRESISVVKRDGSVEELNLDKIHVMVEEACKNLSNVSASQVEIHSDIQFFDGITTKEIQEILIKSANDLISLENTNYQYVAARLLLFSLRKSVHGKLWDHPPLISHINSCIQCGLYDPEILEKYSEGELLKAESFINYDRDFLFTYCGLRQVIDKYLLQNRNTKSYHETPQILYIMIALTVFSDYPRDRRMSYVKRYYDAISKHKLSLPTPIMSGVRSKLRQFASCVLVDIDDDLSSIESSDSAVFRYVSQRAGIGMNFGRIRGIGSDVRGGEVIHTGLIPYLRRSEGTVRSCTQNGVRGGSATCNYPIWHQEIEDLVVLKNNKGTEDNRVRKLDYCVQFSRIFWERFISHGEISLFSPHAVPGLIDAWGCEDFDSLYVQYENDPSIQRRVVSARKLILSVLKERAETGRIYIMNIDHCNTHSSFKDLVKMTNLCVSGDTKIKIKYPKSICDDIGEIYDWKVYEEEIEIGDLDEYISSREIGIMSYKVSDNDPCEDFPQIEVLSYNIETNQQEWKPITAFAETSPKARVMKITDEESGKSIVVTPEHGVFTKNRGYVMAKDLVENDELLIS